MTLFQVPGSNDLIVAFRGTQFLSQDPYTDLTNFGRSWYPNESQVFAAVGEYLQNDHAVKALSVFVTGHSLGGRIGAIIYI